MLRSELVHLGFPGGAISDAPLVGVDLSVSTSCFQAFFTLVHEIGSLERSWKSIQDIIARYKSENSTIPRDLYLTFLLLDAVPVAQLPLVQSIAADPLVCRKIVLATKPEKLREAIERLPFVGMGIGATRPSPGIQDIFAALEERKYPAAVLRVLSERVNTERMLAQLLDMPVPSEVPHVAGDTVSSGHPTVTADICRLRRIGIKNFRGIREADLDLSANVTVIYGQNGTGKTSIFDAIEWALVGSVERLELDNKDDTSGRSPYANLFSAEETSVVASLSVGRFQTAIRRTCGASSNSSLCIDDQEGLDDRNALALIVGQQAAKLDTRILRRLVRTTSFLSQSTLKQFLSDDPGVRYWSLAHLLGTQDYIRLLEKIDDIRKNIDRRNKVLGAALTESMKDIESLRSQIASREALLSSSPGARNLDNSLTELLTEHRNKLQALNSPYATLFSDSYPAYEAQSSLAIVSDWLENEIRQETLIADKLSLAEDAARRRLQLVSSVQELSTHQSALDAGVQRASDSLSRAEDNKSAKRASLASETTKLEQLKERQNRQRESLVITEQMKGLRTLITEQQGQLSSLDAELKEHGSSKMQRIAQLRSLTATQDQLTVALRQVRGQAKALEEAETLSATYSQLALELPSLSAKARAAVATSTEQQQTAFELRTRINSIQQEIGALSRERDRQLASVEKLKSLLADIQEFVEGSECPLCGHNWDSTDSLKRAVDARTTWLSPRVKQLDDQLLQMRQRESGSRTALSHVEQELRRLADVASDAESRLEQIRSLELQVQQLLLKAGVPDQAEIKTVLTLRDEKAAELARLNETVARNESALARLRDELSQLEAETTRKQEVRERMAARLADTQRRLNGLLAQLGALGISAEPDGDILRSLIDSTAQDILRTEKSRTNALKEFSEAETLFEERTVGLASATRTAEDNRKRISTLDDTLKRIHSILLDAQLEIDSSPDLVKVKLEEKASRISGVKDARTTTRQLEQISSWLIARREIGELNDKIGDIARNNETLTAESQALSRWHSHLSTLYVVLVTIKAEVENLQLEKYGPTINLLYQRLNTHPLFTDLKVLVDATAQSVRIQLQASPSLAAPSMPEGLAPARYFSEAQFNIVALSIFLSHSFQQRWSRFVPVFLDDPVQNMDDFNANGFVDCLRSLAGAERQFIVSTCDIGLYRLLLLKLRCMNQDGPVRFRAYRLEGVSDRGPRVVQDLPVAEALPVAITDTPVERVH